MATSFFYRAGVYARLLAGGSLLLSGCKQVCEQNLPTYHLSEAQFGWRAPYVPDTVWRFRNAAGYERRYRILNVGTELPAKGSNKGNFCNTYYKEQYTANVGRIDSTQSANFKTGACQLFMEAALPGGIGNGNKFQWNDYSFYLPTDEVAAGQYPLTTAKFGSRTYTNVIAISAATTVPSLRLHVYLTVADGVVAFDDLYGNFWSRQ